MVQDIYNNHKTFIYIKKFKMRKVYILYTKNTRVNRWIFEVT